MKKTWMKSFFLSFEKPYMPWILLSGLMIATLIRYFKWLNPIEHIVRFFGG